MSNYICSESEAEFQDVIELLKNWKKDFLSKYLWFCCSGSVASRRSAVRTQLIVAHCLSMNACEWISGGRSRRALAATSLSVSPRRAVAASVVWINNASQCKALPVPSRKPMVYVRPMHCYYLKICLTCEELNNHKSLLEGVSFSNQYFL